MGVKHDMRRVVSIEIITSAKVEWYHNNTFIARKDHSSTRIIDDDADESGDDQ